MPSIKSVIITNDSREIVCEYYEIENMLQDIIKNNSELLLDFKNFAQDYTYFSPYLDYALLKLGYKIRNPLNLEGAILEGKENTIHLVQFSQSLELFSKAGDKAIRLFKLAPENIEICMADNELNAINPEYYDHNRISRLILNYLFIKDEDLYKSFIEELQDEETTALFFDYASFLVNNAAFLRVEKQIVTEKMRQFQAFKNKSVNYEIVGNKNNISDEQKRFIEECVTKGIFNNEDICLETEERIPKV